jgi:long-chain acyl-CoA synthetase
MNIATDRKFDSQPEENFPWLAYYPSCIPAQLDYPAIPAWGLLDQTVRDFPDRIACCYHNQKLTYGELGEASRRTASALERLGVRTGDRVGILLPNIPEYISVLNGIWMAGGVVVSISPLMVPAEISGLLTLTDCRVVISLDLLAPLIFNGDFEPDHLILTSLKNRLPHWQRLGYAFAKIRHLGFRKSDSRIQRQLEEELAKSDPNFAPVEQQSLDETAYILATGGTTGAPKAVELTHRNLVSNAWQIYHWAGTQIGTESLLAILPFFHSYGLMTCVMYGVATACTIIMHHRFSVRNVLKLIDEHQPTIFPIVPRILTALNDYLEQKPQKLDSLRFCISGGAPLDQDVAETFSKYTYATVIEGFGLSEASPVTHIGPLDGTARPGTIGLPLPDVEARIVDAETGQETMPTGEIGELILRGPQVMKGYWKNPEATAEVLRDGWLYTGDLGTCDEDGFFRIVDRKKDLIITSGFNVYPADVEQVMRQFPGIADVAVVGVPDRERGEIVKAVIATQPGKELDHSALKQFCRDKLSKHKCPQLIEIVEGDLPRNFLGKVLRRRLREQETREKPSQVEQTTVTSDLAE